jgi:hypothetical protein
MIFDLAGAGGLGQRSASYREAEGQYNRTATLCISGLAGILRDIASYPSRQPLKYGASRAFAPAWAFWAAWPPEATP